MKRMAIVGAGELGCQVANLAQQDGGYMVIGFFDDFKEKGTFINSIEVIGGVSDISQHYRQNQFDCIFLAIGYNHMASRKSLFDKLSAEIPFGSIVHPSSIIDPSAIIGDGVIIYPGCIIDKHVVIEQNVLLNLGVVISHDSSVGAHSFLAPRVAVAGFSKISECCFLGISSTVIDNVTICANTTIGACSLVNRSIDESAVYVGIPVRRLKSKKIKVV